MKKMTKGAIVTGLGVALLLGGGGTLATWNAEKSTNAGTIQSGNLEIDPQAGVWTVQSTGETYPAAKINEYKVVPGDVLTFEQDIDVTIDGDNLAAVLSLTGMPTNQNFSNSDVHFSRPTLINSTGDDLMADGVLQSTELTASETLTASSTFTFKAEATGSKKATMNLKSVNYLLQQQQPAN